MTHLKVGDKSPSFSGFNQDSVIVTNDDFLNKKLIIFFYPKDNTPGCTAESCNLSKNCLAYMDPKNLWVVNMTEYIEQPLLLVKED